ncbi:MAG TPA: glycosyltransferase family 39 protein [Spirochaetota bacterium]|nr:glycosyltransferase family 39 protein [Spirochaetota bacterium]
MDPATIFDKMLFLDPGAVFTPFRVIVSIALCALLVVAYRFSARPPVAIPTPAPSPKPATRSERLIEWLPIIGVLAVALVIRSINLGINSYNNQEMISLELANFTASPVKTVLNILSLYTFHQPINTFFVKALSLVTTNEIVQRIPSVVFGTAAVYYGFRLGSYLSSKPTGLLMALVIACAPIAVFYSRSIEAYSLYLMLAILQLYYFIRFADEQDRALPLVIVSVVGFYTHFFFAVLVAAEIAYAILRHITGSLARNNAVSIYGALALCIAPMTLWLPIVFETFASAERHIDTTVGQIYFPDMHPIRIVLIMVQVFTGIENPIGATLLSAAAVMCCAYLLIIKKRTHQLLFLIITAFGVLFAFTSQVVSAHKIGGVFPITFRHHIYVFVSLFVPLLTLPDAIQPARIRQIALCALAGGAILLGAVSIHQVTRMQHPDYRSLAHDIRRDYDPRTDALAIANTLYIPSIRYYLHTDRSDYRFYNINFMSGFYISGIATDGPKAHEYRFLKPSRTTLPRVIEDHRIKRVWFVIVEERALGVLSYTQQLEYNLLTDLTELFPSHATIKNYFSPDIKTAILQLQ